VRDSGFSANTSAKSVAVGLHELSPWSMYISASLIVKAIMAGLVFASLVTWTIFVAKFIELFIAKHKLRAAMNWVADARTLGEASSGRSVMRSFVVAAIEGIRLSPGFDSEGGIKERVAASILRIRPVGGPSCSIWHGYARHDCRHRPVCRLVWHGLGHHE
jgi:biopolymer transport protein ExbB